MNDGVLITGKYIVSTDEAIHIFQYLFNHELTRDNLFEYLSECVAYIEELYVGVYEVWI